MAKPATKSAAQPNAPGEAPAVMPRTPRKAAAAKPPIVEIEALALQSDPKPAMRLHELATAILNAAHVPSAAEVQALAAGVLKHVKPNKDKKAKKAKEAKAKDGKKDKAKAEKEGKSVNKRADDKKPKVRLPKHRSA